jgi:lipopolysaccharide/colanic/teichoic acid biosynthesis glycosyltransferase
MTNERDENGNLLPDEERLTRFGKWLRLTSLDELPELFNVLKGDMSLVGPRPLLVKYLPYYKVGERKRHWVRPGLTGLAQVNGRNLLDWDTRLSLDTYYVENMTFYMDLSIMLKTVKNVLLRRDIAMGNKQGLKDLDTERGSSRHDDM